MGPTGFLPSSSDPSLGRLGFADLVAVFREQAEGLLDGRRRPAPHRDQPGHPGGQGGVFGAREAFASAGRSVPIQAQATLDVSGRMLLGTDIAAVLAILESLRVDVVGLNCSTGPEHMREPIRYLAENTPLPVSCIPNAGLPDQRRRSRPLPDAAGADGRPAGGVRP